MGFCIPVFEALAVIFWGLILVLIIFWIFVLILCLMLSYAIVLIIFNHACFPSRFSLGPPQCVRMCVYNAIPPFSPGLYFCPSVKHLCPSHGARYFALFSVWVWISSFFFSFSFVFFFLFFCILNWIAFIASLNPQILTVWPSEIYVIISNNHNYIHLKKAKLTCWEKC